LIFSFICSSKLSKKKHITAIKNVQRRATKLIPGFKDITDEERLKILKLPTLTYRRKRAR
jgi:hypothetical protein